MKAQEVSRAHCLPARLVLRSGGLVGWREGRGLWLKEKEEVLKLDHHFPRCSACSVLGVEQLLGEEDVRCIEKAVSAINSGMFFHTEIWEKEELFY